MGKTLDDEQEEI